MTREVDEETTREQAAAGHTARGMKLFGEGRIDEAIGAFRAVVEIRPDHAESFSNLGAALRRQGDGEGAVSALRRALELDPELASAHFNLGNALAQRGETAEAITAYRAAIASQPDSAGAYNNLANLLSGLERFDDALPVARQAVRLAPDAPDIAVNLGNALLGLNRPRDAAGAYRRAIKLNENFALAHANLGIALKNMEAFEEALGAHRRAVGLGPDDPSFQVGLGVALRESGRAEEAIGAYRKALDLDPAHRPALVNLGIALIDRNQVTEARRVLRRAVEPGGDPASHLGPLDHATAWKNLGLCMLLDGDLAGGARVYEWRWKTREFKSRAFDQPPWDGAGFAGKTLLLHDEQGLGDTLQFVRYAPLIKSLGGRVAVECQAELVRLLTGVAGIDQLIVQGDPLPDFDLHAPFFSLLHLIETSPETIPAGGAYLHADPADQAAARDRLGGAGAGNLRVGLVWAGSPVHRNDRNRSIPARLFAPLLEVPGVDFCSLQVGPAGAQLSELDPAGGRIADPTPHLADFAHTAGLVDGLDLVITVDTAVAHLAGGLGRPVWVLLPFAPDWRWMLERTDSPWYPSMRLFRQKSPGDWAPVLEDLADCLAAFRPPGGGPRR